MAIREVIFRGKRLHDNKWIYGNFISDCEGNPHIIEPRFFCEDGHHLQYEDNTDTPVFIIPETVGQYTGLTDKNGMRIFEGDICRFKRFNDVHIGKIVFNATTASFVMWYQPIVGAYGKKATQKMLLSVCDDIEVIGNIHDNPELLGGENNGINR